jgi:hypothetical protein
MISSHCHNTPKAIVSAPTPLSRGWVYRTPEVIQHCPDISWSAATLHSEIARLSRKKGYCYAKTLYLAKKMNLSL